MTEYNEGDTVKYQLAAKEIKLAVIKKIRSNSIGHRVFELSDGMTIHEDQILIKFDRDNIRNN
jgi:hypothetical protein